MSEQTWLALGYTALALAAMLAVSGLWLLANERRRRRLARPDWGRMMADTDYFRRAMIGVFQAQGYRVHQQWVITDPIERQPREVVFALMRQGELAAALCGRWVIPITSEIITRFEQALARTQVCEGLIVTTGSFSEAATQRARDLPIVLCDGCHLQKWIDELWP